MSGTAQPMMKPMGRPMGGQPSGVGGMLTPQMASAARNMAAMGMGKDNMLAHINPREAAMLMKMGGKGDLNPATGLPQFDDGGGGGGDSTWSAGANDPTGAIAGGNNPVTPNNQFPTGQTWDTLNAAIPNSGGIAGLWQDPNSSQWYNSSGALPQIDPTQMANLSTWYENIGPVGQWNPFDTSFAGGGFIPTPGNPIFQTDPANAQDVVLSPYGDQIAQQQYSAEQTEAINDKRNQGSGLLPFEIALAPLALAGGFAGAGALGLLGDAGAAAADAGSAAAAAGDVFDLGAAGTSIVPDAALGTAADPFAVGAAVTDATAGGVGDAFTGATVAGDLGLGATDAGTAGSALASLGSNPSLAELAAATPDSLVGDASAVTDASAVAGDTWDIPAAAAPDVGGGAGVTGDVGTVGGTDASANADALAAGYQEAPGFSFGEQAADAAPWVPAGQPAAAAGGGVGGWLSTLGDKGLADLSDPMKLLGLGATGVGLINSMTGQNKNVGNVGANENALNSLATQTGQTGAQLQSYLASGTLPPGLMQAVNTATQSAIQNIKAKYAANGMGVNSTPEAQDIAKIQENVPATIATIGQQLLQSGTADLQISQGALQNLLTANTSLNNQTNQAIANLARALSGTGTTTTTTTR